MRNEISKTTVVDNAHAAFGQRQVTPAPEPPPHRRRLAYVAVGMFAYGMGQTVSVIMSSGVAVLLIWWVLRRYR
jgi:hypothetical protein